MTEENLYRYTYNTRMRMGPGSPPYDDEEIQLVLERRLWVPKDILLDETDLYPRIDTGLPVSEISYGRWWHNQGLESTCGVWSVVNSMRTIGVEPDPDYIKQLLNHAITSVNSGQQGISFSQIHEMSRGRNLPVKLTLLNADQTLEHLPHVPYSEDPTGAGIVGKNARIVQQYVTENSALVISRPGRRPDGTRRPHAVCIAGYKVSPDGYMDVQIIDPAIGPRVYGIEALSRKLSVDPRMALVVAKV